MREWLSLCVSAAVMRRALIYAAVEGAILIIINHDDTILRGDLTVAWLLKMSLTILVPYTVSTLSSVSAIRGFQSQRRP